MSRTLGSSLQRVRRNRRPLGWVMASLIVISLAGTFAQCPAMGSMSLMGSVAGDVSERSSMPVEMPCADCSVGGDSRRLDETAPALPGGLKPWFVPALVVVSALLALNLPKSVPIPRRPLLPARPRALKFCVLRI